eukprot:NODE_1021_length_2073_cov_0.064843.p1 type:complete len:321 gc:universal NODE_1021_length_2073_cov_0.064843:67-1029(+)
MSADSGDKENSMDWQPLAEIFPNIPISDIKNTCQDCSSMDQCIDILTEFSNPIKKLEMLYPNIAKESLEQLYFKYKNIEKIAELLAFPSDFKDSDELVRNDWDSSVPLSHKLKKKVEKHGPTDLKHKPVSKNTVQQYKLVALGDVIDLFYKDKGLAKSSKSYYNELNAVISRKQELLKKSRNAFKSRRNHKYSGMGASVASSYSDNIRLIDAEYKELKLKHAYSVLKEQQLDPFEFDFHNLNVAESKIILLNIIDFYKSHRILINGNGVSPSLKLITGKGNNSYEKYSVLNTAIKKLLSDNNIFYENLSSVGQIVIRIAK